MTIKELCKKHINCAVCPYLPICGDRPDNYNLGEDLEVTNAIIKTAKALEQQPKTARWIPVSERLPDEFIDVLCSTDSEEIFIATYLGKMNDGTDCFDDHDGMMWEGDVIAWMPLPKSYEPQEK